MPIRAKGRSSKSIEKKSSKQSDKSELGGMQAGRHAVTIVAAAEASPSGPKKRRQQRSDDTRSRILTAAIKVFSELGYDGASTRSVALRAHIPHTLITYHFKSKAGLWREVMVTVSERLSSVLEQRIHGLRGVNVVTKLRLVFEEFIRFSAANPEFHWLMSHRPGDHSGQVRWLVDHVSRPIIDQVIPLIESAQKEGKFVAGDPYQLQYLFVGAANRIYMLADEVEMITGKSPFSAEAIEEHIANCMRVFFIERA